MRRLPNCVRVYIIGKLYTYYCIDFCQTFYLLMFPISDSWVIICDQSLLTAFLIFGVSMSSNNQYVHKGKIDPLAPRLLI